MERKFLVLADGIVVGWSALPHRDWGMGIVSGIFYPNANYSSIQGVIRSHNLAEDAQSEQRAFLFEEARRRIRALKLSIQSPEKTPLQCEIVFIRDFSAQLEEDAIEVDVLGFLPETLQKFWPLN